jgi:hypothetical protein
MLILSHINLYSLKSTTIRVQPIFKGKEVISERFGQRSRTTF